MIKKVNESFSKILKGVSKENNKTILESLTELNEADTKIVNKKTLNEGAGAGYKVEGTLHGITIQEIKAIETERGPLLLGEGEFASLTVNGLGRCDGSISGYYHGSDTIPDMPVNITRIEINL